VNLTECGRTRTRSIQGGVYSVEPESLEKRKPRRGKCDTSVAGPAGQHSATSTRGVERLCCVLAAASALLFRGEFRPLCVIQALRIKLYVLSYSARSITTGILGSQDHILHGNCSLTHRSLSLNTTVSKASFKAYRYSIFLKTPNMAVLGPI
jgi:hypothetical protein